MNNSSSSEVALRDGWTHDLDYRRCYQTEDDLQTILRLLALTPGCSLVDVGCGNGAFAIAAANNCPDCQVWAFDALDSAIAECQAKAAGLENLRAAKGWAHALPLASASVDRALFRSVLHHLAQPEAAYAELGRVLKPGGRLVLQAPCNNWGAALGRVLSEMMLLADNSHRRFYYRPVEIADGLQRAGFSCSEPECWPYEFPFIEDHEAAFLQQHGAEKELRLRPLQPGKWGIEGCWVRIIAGNAIQRDCRPRERPVVGMRLIRYQPEFQEPMLALHRSAIEGFVLGMTHEQDEADLVAVEDVYLRGHGEFLLGFIGERLVAMGGFKRLSGGLAELRRMRIARELQGQGYGTLLLRELERRAFQSGIRTLCLDTARRRPLTLEFYRKHGYQQTGRSFYGAVETVQFKKALEEQICLDAANQSAAANCVPAKRIGDSSGSGGPPSVG